MDLNKILILLRESMLAVDDIKNVVKGHVYGSYLNNKSKFPCITLWFVAGTTPANIDGVIKASVQVKIWTRQKINPNRVLYEIYDYIYSNFRQKHKYNADVKMSTMIKSDGSTEAVHPGILQETVNKIDYYSLPFIIQCRAIYS